MTTTKGSCSEWKAWHDSQPTGPATLHVTGKCTFPTGGYSVQLKPHVPQGINPKIYIMDKVVHVPTGNVTHIVSHVDVKYSEKTTTVYSEIYILPDEVHVPVREAS